MSSCVNLQRLRQWLDGSLELTSAEEAAMEAHIASCPTCSNLLQADEQTERWRRLVSPHPSQSVDCIQRGGGPMLHLSCPHCRNPIEILGAIPAKEVLCPSCGSHFDLIQDKPAQSTPQAGPQTLGKFILLEMVGAGSFGTVYKARDPELDRTVAIKVPRVGNLGGEHDRFLREARSVAQLRHPRIVPVYEVGQCDGLPYLVSEFVEGITLEDQLKLRRPTPQEAANLMAAVADALHYSHEQGVIHRDLKPSNIMLDAEGHPRVMDFGMAKRDAGEITMTIEGQVLGTPAYMSPEQAKGEGHDVDGRSDVYSIGVMFYELLTGEIPFRGNSRMLLHQVLHDDPKPPRQLNDHISRDLETVCLKAMAKEPLRRYQTAAELRDDLGRFLQGEPIKARPVGRLERLSRWAKRNPKVATLSAAVLILLLAVSAGSVVVAALAIQKQQLLAETQSMTEQLLKIAQEKQELTKKQTKAVEDRKAYLEQLLDLLAQVQPEPVSEEWDEVAPLTVVRTADDYASQIQKLREFLDRHGTEEDRQRFRAVLEPEMYPYANKLPPIVDESLVLPGVMVRVTGAGGMERPFDELALVRAPGGPIPLSGLEELEDQLKKFRREDETYVSGRPDRPGSFFSRVEVRYDKRVTASALMEVVQACRRSGPWSVALKPLRDESLVLNDPLESDVEPLPLMQEGPISVEPPITAVEPVELPGGAADSPPSVLDLLGESLGAGIGGTGGASGLSHPGGFGGRTGSVRERLILERGGTQQSEAAVAAGLTWLAQRQANDGRWPLEAVPEIGDIGGTAFGLLPFLAAGQTHKGQNSPYAKNVQAGLRYLMAQQKENGDFGKGPFPQALAVTALSEAYGLTSDQALKGPAQRALDAIRQTQQPDGGWALEAGQKSDAVLTAWQVMALKTGQLAKLEVRAVALANAGKFLDSTLSARPARRLPDTELAAALLARMHLGWGLRHPALQQGIAELRLAGPQVLRKAEPGAPVIALPYWFFASQVMCHVGDESWDEWNAGLRERLIESQDRGSGPGGLQQKGSWSTANDFSGNIDEERLVATSLALLTLEVYYRQFPLYQRERALSEPTTTPR